MQSYGFAYNKPFIDGLLRKQMGFEGYINSDTGIVHNMNWGVEILDEPERIGYAVNHGGVDLISGLFDNRYGQEAYDRGINDYYEKHPVPEGFQKDEIVLTEEALDRAVTRTLKEMFELGMFENPYRDPEKAAEVVADQRDWEHAMDVHRKSVVLLKNDKTLPLCEEKLKEKKFYAECFHKNPQIGVQATGELKKKLTARGILLTEEYEEADYAILMLHPSSGEYFNATPGYLELELCDGKEVPNVDMEGRPTVEIHKETTLSGVGRIKKIADAVHEHGGRTVGNLNITLAWEIGSVEPYLDALTAGFDTEQTAILDVIFGHFAPVGKLPLTLPRGDEVIAVDMHGVCISPNDVPGSIL